MEWNNELIMEFIQLYESHPVLWNPRHKNHKNRNSLFDAWQDISRNISVDITVEALRKKKESLMATYRTLARKVRLSYTTGSGASDVYVPSWFAYAAIDRFIKATTKKMPSLSSEEFANEDSPEDETIQNEMDRANIENQDEILDNDVIVHEPNQYDNVMDGQKRKKSATHSMVPSQGDTKRKRREGTSQIDEHLKQASHVLQSLVANKQARTIEDAPALYGQLLAQKLRRLSNRTQLILQNQIDNLVFEAEINELDSTSDPTADVSDILNPSPVPSTSGQSSVTHEALKYYYEATPNFLEIIEDNTQQ